MSVLGAIVGGLLVLVAALTVLTVLYIVMKEKHEHPEYFIPLQKPVEEPTTNVPQE